MFEISKYKIYFFLVQNITTMGVELEKAVNSFVNSEHVRKVFGNPIIVGAIIALMVLLIMRFVVRDHIELVDDDKKSFMKLAATTGIYVFVASIGAIYLHNRIVAGGFEKQYENHAMRDTVESTIGRAENSTLDMVNRTVMGDSKVQPTYSQYKSGTRAMRPRSSRSGARSGTRSRPGRSSKSKKSRPTKSRRKSKKGGKSSKKKPPPPPESESETESSESILEEATDPESGDSSYDE